MSKPEVKVPNIGTDKKQITQYVLGFAIDLKTDRVLLIRKQRPKWQLGHLNGIGGRIETNEYPFEAMRREFREETGINTEWKDWFHYATMKGEDWICHCFVSFNINLHDAQSMTDEKIGIFQIGNIRKDFVCISNIPWLISMAIDSKNEKFMAKIDYTQHGNQ